MFVSYLGLFGFSTWSEKLLDFFIFVHLSVSLALLILISLLIHFHLILIYSDVILFQVFAPGWADWFELKTNNKLKDWSIANTVSIMYWID